MTHRETKGQTLFTIGHSTRSLDSFITILQSFAVNLVADIRTVPRSRHNPQFNKESLPQALDENGIGYVHMKDLGGLRKSHPDSPNSGWRNASFRGFADYMQTPEFVSALGQLMETAARHRTVLMCAETLPWRCHRSLIADALTIRGNTVCHIMGEAKEQEHRLTPFARVQGLEITYPEAVVKSEKT